ncbi:MAG: hypothetical protein JXM69_14265 [Anaerolineae bacterium]|nr:hypothetical protein [Anaerolineae bacterium]
MIDTVSIPAIEKEQQPPENQPKSGENDNVGYPVVTFYVYVELLKPGQSNRPIRETKKLKRVSRRYKAAFGNEAETQHRTERACIKALESAVEFACDVLYRLRDEGIPFTRVFVSEFGDTGAARKDFGSFNYSL